MTTYNQPGARKEEDLNALTHGIGAVLSVVALILMLYYSLKNGSAVEVVCSLIFGLSMVLLYSSSALYHYAEKKKFKTPLRRADHISIYLLIAGTYTPVMAIAVGGKWAWWILGIVWGLVAIGFIFKLSPHWRNEKISLSLYLLMGWLAVVAFKPLLDILPLSALTLIILGGLSYTIGVYFYVKDDKPYYHTIWHLFVLAGTLFHFLAIFFYIIP